jgi:membrane protein involved in D-alanine export
VTPYADFLYFGLLLYPVIPTVILGLLGRISWRWILLVTLVVVAVQYSDTLQIGRSVAITAIWVVAGYALVEWLNARAFLWARGRTSQHWPFYAALALGLLPLLIVKFLPLVAPGSLFGFLGISYITFRSLDVIFGIQDQLIADLPVSQYCAYLLFFPTISSGPIDRYRRFAAEWRCVRDRAEFLRDLDGCVQHVFTGLLYKFILAYLIKHYWLDPAARASGVVGALAYMYAYSLYLFFDFAGYSAFAIGLSYLFGIHTPENFNRPFLARDIREFWNRWHISLSTWLRDHVFMRFVLAAARRRWFSSKHIGSYLGFLLSFGLMGLWHGTQFHYLLYGLYHAALMIGHDIFSRWNKTRKLWGDGPIWRAAGIAITFNLVCFGFLLFSGYLDTAQLLAKR